MKLIRKFFVFLLETIFVATLVVIVGVSILSKTGRTVANYTTLVITSGSMEPTVKTGSLIITRSSPVDTIQKGDVITFKNPKDANKLVTHRVDELIKKPNGTTAFHTKGDANNTVDIWEIGPNLVVGKMVFSVPFLGFIVNFIKTVPGFLLFVVVPALIIVVSEIHKIKKAIEAEIHKGKSAATGHTEVIAFLFISITLLSMLIPQSLASYNSVADNTANSFGSTWWVPPTVQLLSPNGGQSLYQGNNYSIMWTASSSDPLATVTIDLYYSTDNGATYGNTIATGETNDGIYSWTAPSIFSSGVRIKVVATDSHSLVNEDASNADFSIISPIVMNEFLPNPLGADDAAMPGGEWVELRNNGSVAVDVNGWALYDSIDTHELAITAANSDNDGDTADSGETVVPAGGFLVVYRNADGDFSLNNTGGDTVRLYNGSVSTSVLIDSYTYTLDPVPDNKSFARIPDGTGPWIDPDPTPGRPNVLTEDYLTLPGNQEISEENQMSDQTPTETPLPSVSLTPTPEASPSPSLSPTVSETQEPEATQAAVSVTEPAPVESPTPAVTPEPTPIPESESAPDETPMPTIDPTPTTEPTPVPMETPGPTPEPTQAPESTSSTQPIEEVTPTPAA